MVYPEQYEQPQYESRKSPSEVILGNIIKGVVAIFLIVIGFFIIILVISVLNTQTGVQYTNYTGNFAISDPLVTQSIYTSNPLLSSMTVKRYNSSNLTYGNLDSAFWTFNADTSEIQISGGMNHFDTSLRVDALTDYAESPHLSVLTAWSLALIVLAVAGIFGIVAYSRYDSNRNPYR